MAVPKKRTGASAQAKRRANWKAIKPTTTTCKNCGATALTHTVCTECGYYKGKAVSIKSADYVETPIKAEKEVKPKKAVAKKTTKKAKVEKAVVEEAVVEEAKAEAVEETPKTEE